MHAPRKPPRQPNRGVPFVVGQVTPIGKIISVIPGDTLMQTSYEVERACCGEIRQISYPNLRSSDYQKPKLCRSCASRENALKSSRVQMHTHKKLRIAGVTDATGYFWPFLGHMGARFGKGQPVLGGGSI